MMYTAGERHLQFWNVYIYSLNYLFIYLFIMDKYVCICACIYISCIRIHIHLNGICDMIRRARQRLLKFWYVLINHK
jgi:hypothetical protein